MLHKKRYLQDFSEIYYFRTKIIKSLYFVYSLKRGFYGYLNIFFIGLKVQ